MTDETSARTSNTRDIPPTDPAYWEGLYEREKALTEPLRVALESIAGTHGRKCASPHRVAECALEAERLARSSTFETGDKMANHTPI